VVVRFDGHCDGSPTAVGGRTLEGMGRGFVVAVSIALLIEVGGVTLSAGAAGHRSAKSPDIVYFRPVLCVAPSYTNTISDPGPLSSSHAAEQAA
jgi:hypothetical protein